MSFNATFILWIEIGECLSLPVEGRAMVVRLDTEGECLLGGYFELIQGHDHY